MSHTLHLSPAGHLLFRPDDSALPALSTAAASQLAEGFEAGAARGLELLASRYLDESFPPVLAFWRSFARCFFTDLCHQPGGANEAPSALPPPADDVWTALVESAPPMVGLEYLNRDTLAQLWRELDEHVRAAIGRTAGGASAYLKQCHPAWNTVGRVTFHLAENKRNAANPFAFLATYAHRISEQGKVQHLPLGRALEEYAGAQNRAALAALLTPVQRAAELSPLGRDLLQSRAVFHPQVWRPDQAFAFLNQIPTFEQAGLIVRIPDWWKAGRPPRPQVNVRIGDAAGGGLGADRLMDFNISTSLGGEPLTPGELKSILQATSGLVLLKGQWVEVDPTRLQQVLDHWKKVQSDVRAGGVSMSEALRLLSGFDTRSGEEPAADTARAEWSSVVAGSHLARLLEQMGSPAITAESDPGDALRATLRAYQRQGAHWLWFMSRLNLGACLADDMGLGKTIQVISLLLVLKRQRAAGTAKTSAEASPASLLVVPASLLANWKSEIQRFAPSLTFFFAHPSETDPRRLAAAAEKPAAVLTQHDLVITTYAMLTRLEWLQAARWNIVILDEAQAIKNAGARQTRAARSLQSRHRIALSGTPIENRLSDLWSLFDFLNPGLLGDASSFSRFVKARSAVAENPFGPLRRLVRPYILRRLKTDKRVIADLPDKVEMTAFCSLTRKQAALYQQSVQELAERLEDANIPPIQRRGVVLAFLTRFKQICNHPSQWLGDGAYAQADSGKFQRLQAVCESIVARQEKALVFTQFREMTEPLARLLAEIFSRPGLILHGGTPVGQRRKLVEDFQDPDGPPFFVLSLKAGGTGLNLTAASHVIHFDRWWNPAVENQATDRAFRIGQKRNVVVHKFTCKGTLEERIHEIIAAKSALADDVLGEGGERLLTEMSNSELLRFVALDINAVVDE